MTPQAAPFALLLLVGSVLAVFGVLEWIDAHYGPRRDPRKGRMAATVAAGGLSLVALACWKLVT